MTLQSLRQKLEANTELLISERGTGKAKFLYVRSPHRAIEVSEQGDGFSSEYWNTADEESDEDSVKKEIVKSESDAFAKIKSWFVSE